MQAGRGHARGEAELAEVAALAVVAARHGAERAGVGQRAEAEEHVATAGRGKVVGRKISAGRFDLVLAKLQQPEWLDGDVFRQADRRLHHVDWQERLFQLGAGQAQFREIDRVDHVDAVRDERALAEAEHLAADAQIDRALGDVEFGEHVGIKQLAVAAHAVDGLAGKWGAVAGAVDVFEIVEIVAADERAEVAVA